MEVVSSCPMQTMGFVWQSNAGTFAQTIVVKATFVLEPGCAKLASEAEREEIWETDRFVKDNTNGVLFAPTDRVPYKRRVDVMLVGHAYAPGKQPVRSLVTKVEVGNFSKSIEVFCDRGFRSAEERLLEGPRFTKMPLDWTRATGGSNTPNPVGKRVDAPPDAFGLSSMANLQPPKTIVTKGSDTFAPMGYGPIAPTWPGRKQQLDRLSGTFSPAGWNERPLPENFDFEYFQAAPPDQQLERVRPDERLVLENLHPVHAHLETRLPGVCPRAVVHRASGEREDVTLVADTLWIDSDRGIACVVWRGSIGLRHPTEAGLVGVALVEPVAESIDESFVITIPPGIVDEDELASMTMVAPFGTKPKGPVVPFVGTNFPERAKNPVRSSDDGALPFGPSGLSGIPPAPIAMGQITLPAQSPTSSPTVPEIKLPVAHRLEHAAYAPPPPPVSIAAGSTTAPSVWDAGAPTERKTTDCSAIEVICTQSRQSQKFLQLLWFDTHGVMQMRSSPLWRSFSEQSGQTRQTEGHDSTNEARLAAFEVLAKAAPASAKGIEKAFDDAIGDHEKLAPPILVLEGELEFSFDEIETVKAALSTAMPCVASGNDRLKTILSDANDFLRLPFLSASPTACEAFTKRIRESCIAEKNALTPNSFDAQVLYVLSTGRHYQKRRVFGGSFVRCSMWLFGEDKPIVTYLPADATETLPIWKRFGVRLIVEVFPAQDEYEASPWALKVLGIARVGQ